MNKAQSTIDPDYLHALDLMEAKQWEVAREKLQLILSESPARGGRLAEIYCALGQCHMAIGDLDSARDAWSFATSVDPANSRAVSLLWELEELRYKRT